MDTVLIGLAPHPPPGVLLIKPPQRMRPQYRRNRLYILKCLSTHNRTTSYWRLNRKPALLRHGSGKHLERQQWLDRYRTRWWNLEA